MEVTDLALAFGSESVVGAAVVGSARTGHVLDAGSAREDGSSDVCYVGHTHHSHSLSKKKKQHLAHSSSLPNNTRGSWLLDIVTEDCEN